MICTSSSEKVERRPHQAQFFIVVADSTFLDEQYSVFGEVTKGMDVADKIVYAPRDPASDLPHEPVSIIKVAVREAMADEIVPAQQ